MRGQAHSEETRTAVMAALLAGLGISEVARRYQLPKTTVARIKAQLGPERLEQLGTERRASLDDLLLEGLAANLAAQKRIAEAASEREYLQQHSPAAVADLYQAFADHSIRLLEAASWGDGADPEDGPEAAAPAEP